MERDGGLSRLIGMHQARLKQNTRKSATQSSTLPALPSPPPKPVAKHRRRHRHRARGGGARTERRFRGFQRQKRSALEASTAIERHRRAVEHRKMSVLTRPTSSSCSSDGETATASTARTRHYSRVRGKGGLDEHYQRQWLRGCDRVQHQTFGQIHEMSGLLAELASSKRRNVIRCANESRDRLGRLAQSIAIVHDSALLDSEQLARLHIRKREHPRGRGHEGEGASHAQKQHHQGRVQLIPVPPPAQDSRQALRAERLGHTLRLIKAEDSELESEGKRAVAELLRREGLFKDEQEAALQKLNFIKHETARKLRVSGSVALALVGKTDIFAVPQWMRVRVGFTLWHSGAKRKSLHLPAEHPVDSPENDWRVGETEYVDVDAIPELFSEPLQLPSFSSQSTPQSPRLPGSGLGRISKKALDVLDRDVVDAPAEALVLSLECLHGNVRKLRYDWMHQIEQSTRERALPLSKREQSMRAQKLRVLECLETIRGAIEARPERNLHLRKHAMFTPGPDEFSTETHHTLLGLATLSLGDVLNAKRGEVTETLAFSLPKYVRRHELYGRFADCADAALGAVQVRVRLST